MLLNGAPYANSTKMQVGELGHLGRNDDPAKYTAAYLVSSTSEASGRASSTVEKRWYFQTPIFPFIGSLCGWPAGRNLRGQDSIPSMSPDPFICSRTVATPAREREKQ